MNGQMKGCEERLICAHNSISLHIHGMWLCVVRVQMHGVIPLIKLCKCVSVYVCGACKRARVICLFTYVCVFMLDELWLIHLSEMRAFTCLLARSVAFA